MTRRSFALLIPLAFAGCAIAPRGSEDGGLEARMYPSNVGVRVALSEPAYVAIFQVFPGERVALFYPAVESDPARIAAGRSTLFPGGRRIRAYPNSFYGPQAPLLYMIASRHPLDEALIRDLQEGLGNMVSDVFRSNDAGETMETLASLVVPADQLETDWTEDVLPLYPGGQSARTRTAESNQGMCRSAMGDAGGDYVCLTPAQQAGQRRQPPPPLPGGGGTQPTPRSRSN